MFSKEKLETCLIFIDVHSGVSEMYIVCHFLAGSLFKGL